MSPSFYTIRPICKSAFPPLFPFSSQEQGFILPAINYQFFLFLIIDNKGYFIVIHFDNKFKLAQCLPPAAWNVESLPRRSIYPPRWTRKVSPGQANALSFPGKQSMDPRFPASRHLQWNYDYRLFPSTWTITCRAWFLLRSNVLQISRTGKRMVPFPESL